MRVNWTHAIFGALALAIALPALADGPGAAGPDVAAPPVRAAPIRPAPAPAAAAQPPAEGRSGTIALADGEFALNVPNGYKFYTAEEAYAFMQRNSAASPAGSVLGMIAKNGADVRAPGTWATIVSYDSIGYVQSETASGLADANFETDVRTARASQNRPFEGFAAPAAFDAAADPTRPELVWAERSAAPGSQAPDLRFEQRTLGRHGVATLTSIGSADQMPEIQAAAIQYKTMLSFPEGRRHSDFVAASDQVSAFTVPGLVTGVSAAQAVAETPAAGGEAQTGFGGLAGWFPWIALGVVVLAGAGYMLTRRRNDAAAEDDDDDAEAEPVKAKVVAPPPPPPPPPPAAEEPKSD
jgi:LPXTG-motif cell wall-anchored protein